MTVVVCGLATVGASMAAWLLERGHTVVGVDTDASKREAVAGGRAPVSEPGMAEAFADGVATGRLSVADDLARAMMDPAVDTVAIAVGTPRAEDGSLSLAQIHAATNAVIDGIRRRPDEGSCRKRVGAAGVEQHDGDRDARLQPVDQR